MKLKNLRFFKVISTIGMRHDLVEIPDDMLRYDLAFRHPRLPHVVAFPQLNGYGGKPTHGRWLSFGYKLEVLEQAPDLWYSEQNAWYTMRHPRASGFKFSSVDYGRLVPVTLDKFLVAKSIQEVENPIQP